MKIYVKSYPENYEKEESGRKSNTIRMLDGNDIIEVLNTETGKTFTRTIKDITVYKGIIVISC